MSRTWKKRNRKTHVKNMPNIQRCRKSGKACHTSHESAKRHLQEMNDKPSVDEGYMDIYVCEYCRYFHIGHPKGS